MFGRNKKLLTTGLSLLLSVTLTSLAVAKIGQSFSTREADLAQGMAVSLSLESPDSKQYVEALTPSNSERFVGVAAAKESNIATTVRSGDNIFVTTSGQVEVLVTDLNGEIKKGDTLVPSPLKGVVMRDDGNEQNLVGYSLENLDFTDSSSQTLTDEQGGTRQVRVASTSMEIGAPKGIDKVEKAFLSLVGESIIGKPVSQLQVIAALLLLFVLLTVEGSIIYGAAHSTIQSVGRNPLARKGIYKQLRQILTTAVIILVFGLGGIYLILWA